MSKPNLFKLATSELTQDRFFAWLISYSLKDCQQYDATLHEAAVDFVKFLLKQNDPDSADFETLQINDLEVKTQYHSMDLAIFLTCDTKSVKNQRKIIVIEDKTWTGTHDDQLSRYKDLILGDESNKGLSGKDFSFIYLKTGIESLHTTCCILGEGWSTIYKDQLINYFKRWMEGSNTVDNDIFTDYYDYLVYLKSLEQFNLVLPDGTLDKDKTDLKRITSSYDACNAFLLALENSKNCTVDKGWEYSNNAKGGHYSFYFSLANNRNDAYETTYITANSAGDTYELYGQINLTISELDKELTAKELFNSHIEITLRIAGFKKEGDRFNTETCDMWNLFEYINKKSEGSHFIFKKPARFHPGKSSIIANLDIGDNRVGDYFFNKVELDDENYSFSLNALSTYLTEYINHCASIFNIHKVQSTLDKEESAIILNLDINRLNKEE